MNLLVRGIACVSLSMSTVQTMDGYATHYSPGLFERVARNRGMPVADCMVAYDRAPLGTFVGIAGVRTGMMRQCQVTDVSAPRDRARHLRDGLVELDYASAQHICGKWWRMRWRECPVVITRIGERHE